MSVSPDPGAAGPAGEAASADDPWLVMGLGNPGPQYVANRHNVGFLVAEVLAGRIGGSFRAHKSRALVATGRLGSPGVAGPRVVLGKPMSFMNLSGGPTGALAAFYKIPISRLVVIHDELDIGFGALRLKRGGGDNGHNGLRSVSATLGRDYYRVRFGVGRPPGRMDAAAYVLRDFSAAERKEMDYLVDRAADAVETLITQGLEPAQNAFNA